MELDKKYAGNYDIIRMIAFFMVLAQHYFVECGRSGIAIPRLISYFIGGRISWNGRSRIVFSSFRFSFVA